MKSDFLTLIAVILVGINHGIMQAYLNTTNRASSISDEIVNVAVPTSLNTLSCFLLIWGIASSKKSTLSKTILMLLLVSFIGAELYYIYSKSDMIVLGQVLLHVSTVFKLYILVTLHCDVTSVASNDIFTKSYMFLEKQINAIYKSFSKKESTEPKEPKEPKDKEVKPEPKEPKEVKPEPDYIKATQIFNEVLAKTDYTPEEKVELKERFNGGIKEENPWNTMWNIFNNSVLNRIGEQMTKEEKDIQRNNFRIAMGKTPKV